MFPLRKNALYIAALGFASLMSGANTHAQSADKILKNYIKAIGGEKKLKPVSSFRATGEVRDESTGQAGSFTWEMKAPDNLYLEFTGDGLSRSEGFNGRSGWEQDGANPPHTLTGARSSQLRATAYFWNDRFQTYSKMGAQAVFAGHETVEGKRADAIEMTTTRGGIHRKFLFDPQTGLLVKQIEEGEGAQGDVYFSDYRSCDGVMEPFHLIFKNGSNTLDVTLREVQHNAPLEEAVFAFPSAKKSPALDEANLFRDVEANQKQLDLVRRNYIYNMDQTGLVTDTKGKTKEDEAESYEVFFLGHKEVDRLIAKNGKPLSPEEKKKEDARVDKIYAQHQDKLKKKSASGAEKKDADDSEAEGDLGIKDFLAMSSFVNPRIERFHGKGMLVFDFAPRPGAKPKTLRERFVQTLSGVVWIDPDAKEIVRLEARSNDNFKLDGGLLVSLQRGMYVAIEQEYVRGEVWLPSYAEVHFSARALLFVHVKGDVIERFSNYRKFGSQIQIKPDPSNNR
jgi:hypothetical protein